MKDRNDKFVDLATGLTIAGILLYYLGWMYWEAYFLALSIRPSLIDISFDKIIVTTWLTFIVVLLSFGMTWQHIFERKEDKEFEIIDLLLASISSLCLALQSEIADYFYYALGVTFGIYFILRMLIRYNKIKSPKISRQKAFISFSVAIYLFGIYYYRNRGEKDAESLMKNYYENIELKMVNGDPIYGKFITFMNNKYFLIIENQSCEKEVIIISDNEAYQAKFLIY